MSNVDTSFDYAKSRKIVKMEQGYYLAVMSCGAYCATMASNYNSRGRGAEVLVKGAEAFLVRKRETYKDLINKEIVI